MKMFEGFSRIMNSNLIESKAILESYDEEVEINEGVRFKTLQSHLVDFKIVTGFSRLFLWKSFKK